MLQQPDVIIAGKVFQNIFEQHLPIERVEQVTFLDYGLHNVSAKLRMAVQEQIGSLPQASRVLLGYGLCGNGLNGVHAGIHILIIARIDDSLSIQSFQDELCPK